MKQRLSANSFFRLIAFVRPYKKLFVFALVAVITLSVLGPLRPYLIGKAVDQFIVKEQNSSKLMVALLGVLGILLIETVVITITDNGIGDNNPLLGEIDDPGALALYGPFVKNA